nr:MAG TPA: hypothetical protein [Bacteriophage sp.]
MSEYFEISHSWFIHTLTPESITPPNLPISPPSHSVHQKTIPILPNNQAKNPIISPQNTLSYPLSLTPVIKP